MSSNIKFKTNSDETKIINNLHDTFEFNFLPEFEI